jgi:4-diphosphocytidyl-2-C-methyl-D-erythritol kinase
MIAFPNCKINLGLSITGKRKDGYHNLETVFYPLPVNDILEIITDGSAKEAELTQSGLAIEGDPKDNLCIKAYHSLKKDFPRLPAIKIHLHKTIPSGGGLGGGSADGAATLKLLNEKFQLHISNDQLLSYALQLGSDCPFFIINQPCFATSRGEQLENMPVDLNGYKILLVNPQIHVNTSWAFSQLTPIKKRKSLKEIITQPITTWREDLKNDFEEIVFSKYAEIKLIKETLYHKGAVYSAMSGTGSTVYGIFHSNQVINTEFPPEYFIKELIC